VRAASQQRQGIILVVLAAMGYAFLPILAKFAYEAGLSGQETVTWRFFIAAPLIWLLVRRIETGNPSTLPKRGLVLLGVLFSFAALVAFFSLERIPASTFIVLAYLYPAIVAVLSLFNGENLPLSGWLALPLTIIGVALTVPEVFTRGFTGLDTTGILLAFANAVLYSVYILISSRLLRGQNALPTASAISISASLASLLMIGAISGLRLPQTLQAWIFVAAIAIVCTVLPITAFFAAIQKLGAPQAAILSTLEPVLVVILSMLLLQEKMLPIQWLGAALIIGASVLLQAGKLYTAQRQRRMVTASQQQVTL
jgi:drug/metabolite transporter (DMT)-like permease